MVWKAVKCHKSVTPVYLDFHIFLIQWVMNALPNYITYVYI